MSDQRNARRIMARMHGLVVLGTLAALSCPPAGRASTEGTLLARAGVIVAQRPMVVECRLVHEDEVRRQEHVFVSRMSRDVVTLELLSDVGRDADQGPTARSALWRLEAEYHLEPCLYGRTLRAALAQFTEGRVRLVLSWIGSTPSDDQFMRAEVYDLDLGSPQPADPGQLLACARRSHAPIAVLQRNSQDRSPFTGDAELLMSAETIHVRLMRNRGPAAAFEYRLHGQRWMQQVTEPVEVVDEEPVPEGIPLVIPAPVPPGAAPAASAPAPTPVQPAVPAPGPRTPRR